MKQRIQTAVFVLLALAAVATTAEMAPFVIPADVNPDSQIAMNWQPLSKNDRLHAKTHFSNESGQRVRLWGVNLSFAANFPTHEDAERIAKRMAAFGINTVRCHHMDTANWPRGIWAQNGKDLHPEAMDRLDYFIDQLAKHGIYTNMNLHVGKKFSAGMDIPESAREFDKMVDIFTPELIDAQKDYARRLLTHKNPYRNNISYAEDFAVAIVEITNEDSLFMWDAENTLRTLPDFYANLLQKQYNAYLKQKYGTHEVLRLTWLPETERLGENILKNPTLTSPNLNTASWNLEQHNDCRALLKAKGYNGKRALGINPAKTDGTGWHLQFNQGQLNLEKDRVYTVEFDAAAGESRLLSVGVLQAHDPWQNLGLSQSVTLESDWKTYRMNFVSTDNDSNGRLSFYFGNEDKPFYLANVKLCPGVEYILNKGESLDDGTVELFGQTESKQRQMDRMIFLAETEKAYFDDMRNFIKNDLNCKAMVTGTIVFGPLALYAQSDMDFIDGHAYWQHPQFPNRSWDPADWLIEQKAMSNHPDGATLYRLAAERLYGKPFTVTEYNHPAPLDAQAECVPMIASFAAAQDWDSVWLYTYSHSNDAWGREHLNSFFDIDTNPAKWGFMPAGAAIFRDATLQPFREITISQLRYENQNLMDSLADFQIKHDRNLTASLSATDKTNMATAVYLTLQQTPKTQPIRTGGRFSVKADLLWNVVNDQGLFVVRNDRCCVLTGHTSRFSEIREPVGIQIDSPETATVAVTMLDEMPGIGFTKLLITACGRCENTDMQFSEDRRTVGTNWGKAPVLIEPVEGTITLPNLAEGIGYTCKILNADGTIKDKFEITDHTVPLKAEYGTMWYLIERNNQ